MAAKGFLKTLLEFEKSLLFCFFKEIYDIEKISKILFHWI